MKDWIPVISAVLGFLAGISGTWLTQRATRQLESDRWEREQTRTRQQEVLQLYVDVAEYIEDRIGWMKNADWANDGYDPAALRLHRAQLGARVKTLAARRVVVAWESFGRAVEDIRDNYRLGNMKEIPELNTATLSDEALIPKAIVGGEIVLLIIRSLVEDRPLEALLPGLKQTLPKDARYANAVDKWIEEASRPSTSPHQIMSAA
jgi:hypothetical protein